MNKSKIMSAIVLMVYLGFVVFQFTNNKYMAYACDALILPLIAITYFLEKKKPDLFFALFLILFSISELITWGSNFVYDPNTYSYYYYIGNGIIIMAYCSLLVEILKSISFFHIIKNLKLHLIVLTGLNVYIAYVLQKIVNPDITNEYFIEISYNVVMLLVLSTSLLNYIYREDRKSLFMFLGSLAIVFSEVISVAYMYVARQNNVLNFLSTSLTLLAFFFYCKQSKLNNSEINKFEVNA